MIRRCTFFLLLACGCFIGALTGAAAEKEWTSPNGRFVFREVEEGDFGVVEVKSGKTLLGGEERVHAIEKEIAAVWAKDSRHLAVNFREGGRYMATQLYELTGKKFRQMPDVTDPISPRGEAARKAEVKRRKLPADIYLRRIWDTYRTERWLDAQTVEVFVYSEKTYVTDKESEDIDSIVVTAVYTVRFGKEGELKIVGRREPTAKERGD